MIPTANITSAVTQIVSNLQDENKALKAEVEKLKVALFDISKIAFEPHIGDHIARREMRRISNNALKKEKGRADE